MKMNGNKISIDFKKIINNGKVISTKESLQDINPIPWNQEVLEGNRKVVVADCATTTQTCHREE